MPSGNQLHGLLKNTPAIENRMFPANETAISGISQIWLESHSPTWNVDRLSLMAPRIYAFS